MPLFISKVASRQLCNADLQGQIKADGGDQQKFDDGMRELRKAGIQAGLAERSLPSTYASGPLLEGLLQAMILKHSQAQNGWVLNSTSPRPGVALSGCDGEDGCQGCPLQGQMQR